MELQCEIYVSCKQRTQRNPCGCRRLWELKVPDYLQNVAVGLSTSPHCSEGIAFHYSTLYLYFGNHGCIWYWHSCNQTAPTTMLPRTALRTGGAASFSALGLLQVKQESLVPQYGCEGSLLLKYSVPHRNHEQWQVRASPEASQN
jgi:hypothetical protein